MMAESDYDVSSLDGLGEWMMEEMMEETIIMEEIGEERDERYNRHRDERYERHRDGETRRLHADHYYANQDMTTSASASTSAFNDHTMRTDYNQRCNQNDVRRRYRERFHSRSRSHSHSRSHSRSRANSPSVRASRDRASRERTHERNHERNHESRCASRERNRECQQASYGRYHHREHRPASYERNRELGPAASEHVRQRLEQYNDHLNSLIDATRERVMEQERNNVTDNSNVTDNNGEHKNGHSAMWDCDNVEGCWAGDDECWASVDEQCFQRWESDQHTFNADDEPRWESNQHTFNANNDIDECWSNISEGGVSGLAEENTSGQDMEGQPDLAEKNTSEQNMEGQPDLQPRTDAGSEDFGVAQAPTGDAQGEVSTSSSSSILVDVCWVL